MSPAPITGGCACGAIRFAAAGPIKFSMICQCRQCQQLTGTGHAVHSGIPRDGFSVTGETASWSRPAASGHMVTNHFCPTCGSPLFGLPTRAETLVMLFAGALDDPGQIAPRKIIHSDEAQPWDLVLPPKHKTA